MKLCTVLLLTAAVLFAQSSLFLHNRVSEAPGESSNIRNEHVVLKPHYMPFAWTRDTSELFWDDSIPEAYYVVSGIPGIHDRFAVRFYPPYTPPMKVTGGRFYTDNSSIPLQSFSVCPDAGGYPDVFHPIDQVDTVYGGFPGWGSYEFHGALFDTHAVWAVVHWIPGYVVGIGADSSSPDGQSFWSNSKDALTWNLFFPCDWMLRLTVAEVTDSHDVTTTAILDPPGQFLPGDTAYPTAVFGNAGLADESFDVFFDIRDSTGSLVYSSSTTLNLASAQVETVTFTPEWIEINEGMYDYYAYTTLATDIDPANDTVHVQGLCTREIVITYCGDYTNMGSAIIGTWATNRKYLVRMTAPIPPPFYIRRSQIFLCDENAPMEYICICPDNGSGLPDTTTILAIGYNVSVPVSHTWATVDYGEILVTDSSDLWMIAKWPEGITEPHIGMTATEPSTERSWRYYYRNNAGHYENMGVDPYFREWYYRLIIAAPPLGITENEYGSSVMGFECLPNPGKPPIKIGFSNFQSEGCEILIYDAIGRLIRTYTHVQGTAVYWDGKDNYRIEVPAGIYFIQLRDKQQKISQKTVLVQ